MTRTRWCKAVLPALALALSLWGCQDRAGADSRWPDGRPAPESAGEERGNARLQEWSARINYAPTALGQPAPPLLVLPLAGVSRAALERADRPTHEGLSIEARRGTTVLAAAGGLVSEVGSTPAGGNAVTVWGPGDRRYYYAHLDAFAPGLEVGRILRAGEPIGLVGDSGSAAGGLTRLYFAVFGADWQAVDPLPLFGPLSGPPSGSGAGR